MYVYIFIKETWDIQGSLWFMVNVSAFTIYERDVVPTWTTQMHMPTAGFGHPRCTVRWFARTCENFGPACTVQQIFDEIQDGFSLGDDRRGLSRNRPDLFPIWIICLIPLLKRIVLEWLGEPKVSAFLNKTRLNHWRKGWHVLTSSIRKSEPGNSLRAPGPADDCIPNDTNRVELHGDQVAQPKL